MIGGKQRMSLETPTCSNNRMQGFLACMTAGTIQHEFMHALGFLHEHVRPDRDEHVNVLEENIKPGMEPQFLKMDMDSWFNMNSPYDEKSVMHYSSFAFSKDIWSPVVLGKNGHEIETNLKYITSIDAQENDIYCI